MTILIALLLAAAPAGMDEYKRALELHQAGKLADALPLYESSWAKGARPPGALWNQACIHARLGHADKAMELLGKTVQAGFGTPDMLRKDDDLASLRARDDFKELLATAEKLARPCDTPAHRAFDFWVGDWIVASPAGQPLGKSKVSRILNGCALLEEWTSGQGRAGKSFNVYDPQAKRWRQTWIDDTNRQTDYAGAFEGASLAFKAEGPGGTQMTMTFTPLEGGRVRQYITVTKDGQEVGPPWEGIYARPQEAQK